jgi:hypothetical protein
VALPLAVTVPQSLAGPGHSESLSVAGWPARPRGPAARAPPPGGRGVCVFLGAGPAGAGGLGAGGPGASAVPAQRTRTCTAGPDERQPDRPRCSHGAPGAIVPLCGLRLEGSCWLPVACAVTCGDRPGPAAKWAARRAGLSNGPAGGAAPGRRDRAPSTGTQPGRSGGARGRRHRAPGPGRGRGASPTLMRGPT